MTQPDGYTPTTAANYDSFAGFAQTTQAEWQAQMGMGMTDSWGALSGICALLEQVPFVGDLINLGGGPNGETWGPLGQLLDGLVAFVENICSLFLGTPQTGTTPTSILSSATGIFDLLSDSPLVAGLLTLVEDTGNLMSDVLMGLLQFINDLCGMFMGSDQGGGTTPQTIADGVDGIFSTINGSGLLTGIIGLANTTGSVILNLLDGFINFLDTLWHLFEPLLDGFFAFTPDGIFGGLNQIISILTAFLEPLMEVTGGILGSIMSVFTDMISLFGLGSGNGLGSGSVNLPILGDIPILGPMIEGLIGMLVGTPTEHTGVTGLGSIFNDLFGLLGHPTGVGSGSPVLDVVDNIPIIGPILAPFTDLLESLLSIPQTVIGAITGVGVDNDGNTMQQTLDSLYSGQSALNTAWGGAGGSNTGGNLPPTSQSSVIGLYRATQTANYSSWQTSSGYDSGTANNYVGGAGGYPAPWQGW